MTSDEERAEEERWARWEARLVSIAVSVVCVAGIINELWFVSVPRTEVLFFLGSVLGLPVAISGAKNITRR